MLGGYPRPSWMGGCRDRNLHLMAAKEPEINPQVYLKCPVLLMFYVLMA